MRLWIRKNWGGMAAILAIALMVGAIKFLDSSWGAEPAVSSDGSIAIPLDLRAKYQDALDRYRQADKTMRETQPLLEQIRSIALREAGIPIDQAGEWKVDLTDGRIKKVAAAK